MGGLDDDSLTSPPPGAIEASAAEGETSPAVGRDEWVARHGLNRSRRGGPLGTIEDRLAVVPWWAWLTLFVAVVALLPVGFESGYVRRVAFDTVVYMLLALGLNVVVGWGGLLDLGFVAFYGIGAYTYAAPQLGQVRRPPGRAADGRRRARGRGGRRLPRRAAVTAPLGRLPGDRDAVLPPDLPHGHDQQ